MVWYSHLLKNFPQFIVIHRVKGFGIVNKAEIDVFLELSCFFHDAADVGNLISGSSALSKTNLNSSRIAEAWLGEQHGDYSNFVFNFTTFVLVAQLCPTLCNSMDCSSPCSSVHRIIQARILEWVAISFSRGSS